MLLDAGALSDSLLPPTRSDHGYDGY